MSKERRILITRRKSERVIIRLDNRTNEHPPCASCLARSAVLPLEEASAACGVSVRAVVRFLENAEIHFAESPSGSLLVCVGSLQAAIRKSKQ